MPERAEPRVDAHHVERLLRAVAGVGDLRVGCSPGGVISAVHILSAPRAQSHQIVRNVGSALHAAFAIDLDHRHVHVHHDERVFTEVCQTVQPQPVVRPAPAAVMPGSAVTPAPAAEPAVSVMAAAAAPAVAPPVEAAPNGNGHGQATTNGNGHAKANGHAPKNGNGGNGGLHRTLDHDSVSAPTGASSNAPTRGRNARSAAAAAPARVRAAAPAVQPVRSADATPMQLERIDYEHHGGTARCRVEVGRGDRSFAAVAEAPHGPTAEADLTARVALDALRAAGLSSATLQGVAFVTIADTNYVVASVRRHDESAPLAGAAPLVDSLAWSAAAAVLSAAGCAVSRMAPVPMPVRRHDAHVNRNQTL